jgi:hypothetical protein
LGTVVRQARFVGSKPAPTEAPLLRPAVVLALVAVLLVGLNTPFAVAAPLPQVYAKPRVIQRGDYADPFYGRQGNRICRRWCLEDRNPCDPPEFKAADGRCFYNN